MLTYGNARLAGSTLKWELQLHERKDAREAGFRPAVVGFFSPPSPVEAVEIWLDDKRALTMDIQAEEKPIILHITRRDAWERAKAVGSYRGDTLDAEGFIHGSTPDQVVRVANAFFRGQHGLVLLHIDPTKLKSPLRYESPPGSTERFPHVYGPVDRDAVVKVEPLEPNADGTFGPRGR